MPACVSALKRVDLPTLGRPTMPHLKPIVQFRFEIRRKPTPNAVLVTATRRCAGDVSPVASPRCAAPPSLPARARWRLRSTRGPPRRGGGAARQRRHGLSTAFHDGGGLEQPAAVDFRKFTVITRRLLLRDAA